MSCVKESNESYLSWCCIKILNSEKLDDLPDGYETFRFFHGFTMPLLL